MKKWTGRSMITPLINDPEPPSIYDDLENFRNPGIPATIRARFYVGTNMSVIDDYDINSTFLSRGLGFTLYPGVGVYVPDQAGLGGEPVTEPSVTFETIRNFDDRTKAPAYFREIAGELRRLFGQDTVLMTLEEITAEFVV